jgi:hypothetical protein
MHTIVPITEDGQWGDLARGMGLSESLMGQEDLFMADLYEGFYDMSSNKKTEDAGLNDLLELQEQANLHDRQMIELVASHVEDLQWSVQTEASNGAWGPQELESNQQANKMVTSFHG